MASYYTKSKVPRTSELATSECSNVEPSDAAPYAVATIFFPSSMFVGPSVVAAGKSGSMSIKPTEYGLSLPPLTFFKAGCFPSSGARGVLEPAGSPLVEISALGYSSGLAGLSKIGARSIDQILPHSLATGMGEAHNSL